MISFSNHNQSRRWERVDLRKWSILGKGERIKGFFKFWLFYAIILGFSSLGEFKVTRWAGCGWKRDMLYVLYVYMYDIIIMIYDFGLIWYFYFFYRCYCSKILVQNICILYFIILLMYCISEFVLLFCM